MAALPSQRARRILRQNAITPSAMRLFLFYAASLWALLAGAALAADPPPAETRVALTNAAQIRSLTPTQTAQAWPVRLRGVVTDVADPRGRALILTDQTAGLYVLANKPLFASHRRGDLLEVTGVTDPGEFAPIVLASSVRKIGTATIPPPRTVTYQQLVSGSLDAQWIELSGVIRRCLEPVNGADISRLVIAANGGLVSVRLLGPRQPEIQEDAEVRVQAICLYQFNRKRQVLTPVLQIPAGVPVVVEKAAPVNPFALPVRTASSLLQFAPESTHAHRVHLQGVVTHAQSGSLVWIRDAASGLRIQTRQENSLQPGDQIDVVGFPSYGADTPVMEDASFRKTGAAPPPAPVPLSAAREAYDHADDLITLDALLTDLQPLMDGLTLTLENNGVVFKAVLRLPAGLPPPDWQPGSQVRLVGICTVLNNEVRPLMGVWHPQSFQIILRSPADLTLRQPPSWWSPRHTVLVLAGLSGLLLLGAGVILWQARQRLLEQARRRTMAETEFAAILAERNRLAREIHDTLAQGLTATSVQLQLAQKHATNADAALHRHLAAAQQLVRGSLAEARQTIWNMRSQVLETTDLPGALAGILKQITDGTELKTDFHIDGQPRRFAPFIENNLLRIGQEAVTNASKHAEARLIRVALAFEEKAFRLTVTDDGLGFDPAQPAAHRAGFGLLGLRERAAEMKAALTVESAPGRGTQISLTLPLSSD